MFESLLKNALGNIDLAEYAAQFREALIYVVNKAERCESLLESINEQLIILNQGKAEENGPGRKQLPDDAGNGAE